MSDLQKDLVRSDCDTLIEALEAWVSKDLMVDMASSLIGGMINEGEQKEAFKRKEEEDQRKRKEERAVRKQTSIQLQAKLYALRDSLHLDSLVASDGGAS